jgi:hypothetical protein
VFLLCQYRPLLSRNCTLQDSSGSVWLRFAPNSFLRSGWYPNVRSTPPKEPTPLLGGTHSCQYHIYMYCVTSYRRKWYWIVYSRTTQLPYTLPYSMYVYLFVLSCGYTVVVHLENHHPSQYLFWKQHVCNC